ncbi:MAG: TMEM43 family protein [Nitratireductor sp.]|nr:TMEM43 family protein [Nitratireductor sp.]
MADSFTEVTHRSWGSRLRGSMSGFLAGLALVLGAIVLLFWNEGSAVRTDRALNEGAGLVATIDPAALTPDLAGRLVHFSGPLAVIGPPADATFGGLPVPANATHLRRTVETYLWTEKTSRKTQKKLGGGEETVTTYSYQKAWTDDYKDSATFREPVGHRNPPAGTLESRVFDASGGQIGAVTLPANFVSPLGAEHDLPLSDALSRRIARTMGRPGTLVDGDTVFIGRSADQPELGDSRIRFQVRTADAASAVGQIVNGRFESFPTANGVAIGMVREGLHSSDAMFASAISANTTATWLMRALGLLAMYIAFRMVLGFLGVFGDVVPFIGNLVRTATGLVALAATCLIGGGVIAIAWLWYRPMLSIAILVAVAGLAFLLTRFSRGRNGPRQATAHFGRT